MEGKLILLFGHYASLKAGTMKGYEVINILTKESLGHDNLHNKKIMEASRTIIVNDESEIEEVVGCLVKQEHIKGIISFTDKHNGVYLANKLTNKYIRGAGFAPNASIEIMNNKAKFREFLLENSFQTVPYQKCQQIGEVADFFKEAESSIIIKPVEGQGSLGVKKINSENELLELKLDGEYIAEKFITGNEYSVETITCNEETHILGITEKILLGDGNEHSNQFVEKGHIMPAQLTPEIYSTISANVKELLNKLNIVNGAAHTEVIVTKEGPVFLETHLRPGGDSIPKLIEIYKGVEIHSLVYDSFMKQEIEVTDRELKKACICFFIPEIGTVESIVVPETVKEDSDVELLDIKIKEGQDIKKITNTFDRSYGHLIVTSSLDEDPLSKAEYLTKQIKISTI